MVARGICKKRKPTNERRRDPVESNDNNTCRAQNQEGMNKVGDALEGTMVGKDCGG